MRSSHAKLHIKFSIKWNENSIELTKEFLSTSIFFRSNEVLHMQKLAIHPSITARTYRTLNFGFVK